MNVSSSIFLRRVLLFDALASGATALFLLLGASFLDRLLGLPAGLLRGAGLFLIPFVLFVAYVGWRDSHVRGAVWSIVVANVAWAAASLLLLASGWVVPTSLGYAFVIAQAVAVGVLAELQVIGLRRQAASAV
jgi:hypothetical protein